MKFDVTQDFKRPADKVLASMCDPQRFKTVMGEYGAESRMTQGAPNPHWECVVLWRDAPQRFTAQLDEAAAPGALSLHVRSALSDATVVMQIEPVEERLTRVSTRVELAPKSMMARVAVQSLRLLRGETERRVRQFVHALGRR